MGIHREVWELGVFTSQKLCALTCQTPVPLHDTTGVWAQEPAVGQL